MLKNKSEISEQRFPLRLGGAIWGSGLGLAYSIKGNGEAFSDGLHLLSNAVPTKLFFPVAFGDIFFLC